MRATGHLPSDACISQPRPGRLIVALQALDGHLAGAKPYDIGVAMFGHARVKRDWRVSDTHLYDHVRRAIKRGRELMEGGYRQFLR